MKVNAQFCTSLFLCVIPAGPLSREEVKGIVKF